MVAGEEDPEAHGAYGQDAARGAHFQHGREDIRRRCRRPRTSGGSDLKNSRLSSDDEYTVGRLCLATTSHVWMSFYIKSFITTLNVFPLGAIRWPCCLRHQVFDVHGQPAVAEARRRSRNQMSQDQTEMERIFPVNTGKSHHCPGLWGVVRLSGNVLSTLQQKISYKSKLFMRLYFPPHPVVIMTTRLHFRCQKRNAEPDLVT